MNSQVSTFPYTAAETPIPKLRYDRRCGISKTS